MTHTEKYLNALENYLQALHNKDHNQYFELRHGKRWTKITHGLRAVTNEDKPTDYGVFCFVDPNNGDIYYPASWAAPAKHVRGNIYDERRPLTTQALMLR